MVDSASQTTWIVRKTLDGLTLIEFDAELRQISGDLGIVGWRLPADSDMASIALGPGDRQLEHLQHARIALVKVEGDDF